MMRTPAKRRGRGWEFITQRSRYHSETCKRRFLSQCPAGSTAVTKSPARTGDFLEVRGLTCFG